MNEPVPAASPLVAIHQPNFLPWLGYFEKLVRADVFVLLDTVQFPKKGGTWINRVRMLVNGEPAWVTVPIVRAYHGTRSVRAMRIDESKPWREKLVKTIRSAYGRAPAFDQVIGTLEELIGNPTDSLAYYNIEAIRALASRLEIDPGKLILASELEVEGAATDLLVEVVRAVGGSAYLAGAGAGGYQQDELFAEAGIELVNQGFEHPDYPQQASQPQHGLSVVDALMNCGFEGAARLLAPAP